MMRIQLHLKFTSGLIFKISYLPNRFVVCEALKAWRKLFNFAQWLYIMSVGSYKGFICLFLNIYLIYLCECVCLYVGVHTCIHKAKRGHSWLSSVSLPVSLRQGLYLNSGLMFSSLDWKPASSSDHLVSAPLRAYRHLWGCPACYVGAGIWTLGSHDCRVNVLNLWAISPASCLCFETESCGVNLTDLKLTAILCLSLQSVRITGVSQYTKLFNGIFSCTFMPTCPASCMINLPFEVEPAHMSEPTLPESAYVFLHFLLLQ